MHCISCSAWVPPGEPESHHWERGCHLGEEESTGGQSPSSAAVHSQVLRQGVRLILLSVSRQTSPAVVAGMAKLVLHHGEPAGVSSPWGPPRAVLGCPTSPKEGHLPHGCTLSKSSAWKSCSELCHMPAWSQSSSSWHPTKGSSWNNSALPPASLPHLPSRVQFLCLPPAPQPRRGEGFPRLLVCHRRTCEPLLWLAAGLGLTQCPDQVFLTLLLASAWLQILLMSVSVSVHSLCKWMGTSACLCLKSTLPSLMITGWSSNTWFSCILVFQKQTINKVNLLNCGFKPATSEAWFRIVIGPARKFLEWQKKYRFPIKCFHLSRDQSCRKFSGHPHTLAASNSWCVHQQCLPPGLVRTIPCYSELCQIWLFNQSRDLEVLEVTLCNISARINYYLSNKRKEEGKQRERKGRGWRKQV